MADTTLPADPTPEAAPARTRRKRISMQLLVQTQLEEGRDGKLRITEENAEEISAALMRLKRVDLAAQGITDIDGLECVGPISHLYLQNNLITELENLESLVHLKALVVSGNTIAELADISFLRNLMLLDLSDNRIADFDPACLPPNLSFLSMSGNLCASQADYKSKILRQIASLKQLDGEFVTAKDRFDAGCSGFDNWEEVDREDEEETEEGSEEEEEEEHGEPDLVHSAERKAAIAAKVQAMLLPLPKKLEKQEQAGSESVTSVKHRREEMHQKGEVRRKEMNDEFQRHTEELEKVRAKLPSRQAPPKERPAPREKVLPAPPVPLAPAVQTLGLGLLAPAAPVGSVASALDAPPQSTPPSGVSPKRVSSGRAVSSASSSSSSSGSGIRRASSAEVKDARKGSAGVDKQRSTETLSPVPPSASATRISPQSARKRPSVPPSSPKKAAGSGGMPEPAAPSPGGGSRMSKHSKLPSVPSKASPVESDK